MDFLLVSVFVTFHLTLTAKMLEEENRTASHRPALRNAMLTGFAVVLLAVLLILPFVMTTWWFPPQGTIGHAQGSVTEAIKQAKWSELIPWTGLLYFGVMVSGMFGEYMFGLKALKDFELLELIRPLWAAIIVFGVPWTTIDHQSISYASISSCYTNGFFWKSVLSTRKPRRARSPKSKVDSQTSMDV